MKDRAGRPILATSPGGILKPPDTAYLCPMGGEHDCNGPIWTFPETHDGGATCSKCGGWPINGFFPEQPPTYRVKAS